LVLLKTRSVCLLVEWRLTVKGGLHVTRNLLGRVSGILIAAAVLAAPALTSPVAAQSRIDGLWDAVVVANGSDVPFRFEIATKGTEAQGFFFEGDRKVGSTSGSFADGVLKLEYEFLNTTLEATRDGDQLRGTYQTNRANARPQEIRARRFAPAPSGAANPPQVAGDWEMRRNAAEANAPRDTRTWHLLLRQSGAEVSGAILRIDGDTGTLVGRWRDEALVLSHFAGERPMLFEAKPNPDGTLAVTLNGTANYLAVRSVDARAKGIPEPPDPSRYTNVKDPTTPFHFSFPDLSGKMVSDADARFRGKVAILSIGGSWCPNCHDEAPFLSELYRDYNARGLEIAGLMFENDADPKVAVPRVQSFIRRHDVRYPMLIAGTTQNINEKLPQIVNFGAYPTTIFLGRDGRVRSVKAGFASPATGAEHVRLKQEVRELVERLLAEPLQGSAPGR
jgi:thiol-disulfide isomerase/thioredoxin